MKGSCKFSVLGEADALSLMVHLNLTVLSWVTLHEDLLSLSKNVARGGALYSRTTLSTSLKAKESCFSLSKLDGCVSYISVFSFMFSLSASATWKPPQHSLSLIVFFWDVIVADEGQAGECFLQQSYKCSTKPEKIQTLNVQTGVKITANSVLSTFPFHFRRVERSRAHHKCSSTGGI